ncbi:MAG TPA: glycosyltransferase [Hyphomicrobiaceae bacterium]|jgi:glycosyltransferase involved in cell wall biosynthesis|nr:glycosyltransferase [Hyphomicrobiaceae bacterium]
MVQTARKDLAEGPAPLSAPGSAGKVVVIAGADRAAMAHCRVLLDVLRELATDVVVVTRAGAGLFDVPDVSVVTLDGGRRSNGLLPRAGDAWKLACMLEAERPQTVHSIGVEPATLAALAFSLAPTARAILHLPDLARLDPRSNGMAWPRRKLASRLLAALARKPGSFLLLDCEDDLGDLRLQGIDPGPRVAVLAGTGVDPDVYPVLPPSQSEMPIAAYVGPVDEAHGVRELLQTFERLWARGLRLQIEVHGDRGGEGAAPDALAQEWHRWRLHPGVRTFGWPADAREIWRRAEICVLPAHERRGLPRVLLEAAACGRALIVSGAAGGRTFVRNEVEGIVVPVQDSSALGAALERLARDASLRQRMGAAARLRVLQGFTEAHVKEALRGAYLSLLRAGQL